MGQHRLPPSIDIISGGRQGLTLSITIHGMWVKDTIVDGITYQILSIPECAQVSDPGKPMLPFISKMIAIAPQTGVCLTIEGSEFVTLDNYYIFPAQYPQYDSIQVLPFVIDSAIYGQNVFFPEDAAICKPPAIFRDLRVTNLQYFPIQFNPVTHQLEIRKEVILTANFVGTDTVNTLFSWPTSVAPLYASMYENSMLNYNTLGIPTGTLTKPKYLIISDASFVGSLSPFIFWKRKKGLEVFVETIVTSEQRTPIYIKNLIIDYFVTPARRVTYVLLVGDALEVADSTFSVDEPLIPIYYSWPHPMDGYSYSDYWYTTIVGNDDIADVALGRFSVWTPAQCSTVVNKTFAFERYPDEDHWFIKRHDLVSYRRTLKQNSAFHECKMDSIANPILTPCGFQYYDDWGEDSTDEDVISHINNSGIKKGISLLNYYGHGNTQSWSTWYSGAPPTGAFTNTTIYSLTNFIDSHNAWLPIVFEIACWCGRVGWSYDTTCHSECWLRCSSGGGVAALGGANVSDVDRNTKFDTELYRVSFGDAVRPPITQELGWVINNAKVKMAEAYGWDDRAKGNVRIYHLMGDPEIDIYTGWNGYIHANHLKCTSDEPQNFVVTVWDEEVMPVPWALVCLYQRRTGLHEIQLTDENGEASFWITPRPELIYITVTKHDYGPYEGTCRVIPIGAGGPQAQSDSCFFAFNSALYNPKTRTVNVSYQLPKKSFVEIRVYEVTGRLVNIIAKDRRHAGFNQDIWPCQDDYSKTVSHGVYFIKLKSEEFEATRKVVIY